MPEQTDLAAAQALRAARDAALRQRRNPGHQSLIGKTPAESELVEALLFGELQGLPDRFERLVGENSELRRLLAVAYSGPHLYTDDGELQDNSKQPFIDYLRDSVAELTRKLSARSQAALQEQPQ